MSAEERNDRLRDLLRREVDAAADDVLRSDGRGLARRHRSLSRLARLVALHESSHPPPKRRRWPFLLVLGAAFAIVSLLIALRVPETEVELDLLLSELGFVSPASQKITEAIGVSELGVSGIDELEIGGNRSRTSAARLKGGSIDLEPLLVPAGTKVWLRCIPPGGRYRLSLTGAKPEIRASAYGPVQLARADGEQTDDDFSMPRTVVFRGGTGAADLDLKLVDPKTNAVSPQLDAAQLSFLRVDETKTGEQTAVRVVSTILSGTLYLESLNGRAIPLRASEVLGFDHAAGEIRTLRLAPDRVELRFHGRVRGMTIGDGEGRRSLMPTWLDWLKERHGLSLFWATALYLFGMIAGVMRWLGRPL